MAQYIIKVIKFVSVSYLFTLSHCSQMKADNQQKQRSRELVSQLVWVGVSCEQAPTLGSHNSVSLIH